MCGKAFARTFHLKRHIESVHKQDAAKNKIIKNFERINEEDEETITVMAEDETVYITRDDDDDTTEYIIGDAGTPGAGGALFYC